MQSIKDAFKDFREDFEELRNESESKSDFEKRLNQEFLPIKESIQSIFKEKLNDLKNKSLNSSQEPSSIPEVSGIPVKNNNTSNESLKIVKNNDKITDDNINESKKDDKKDDLSKDCSGDDYLL